MALVFDVRPGEVVVLDGIGEIELQHKSGGRARLKINIPRERCAVTVRQGGEPEQQRTGAKADDLG